MAQRLIKSPYLDDRGAGDASTGEETSTAEILDSLRVTTHDDPYDFRMKFSKAYKMMFALEDEATAIQS